MTRYVDLAKLVTASWEAVLCVSAGDKVMPAWESMSTPEARALQRDVRRAIKDHIPRQITIDDFWIELKQTHQEFSKSSDNGYHFGCLQADYAELGIVEELKNRLAGHRGKMLTDLIVLLWPSITQGLRYGAIEFACERNFELRRRQGVENTLYRVLNTCPPPAVGETPRLVLRPCAEGETPRWQACRTVIGQALGPPVTHRWERRAL